MRADLEKKRVDAILDEQERRVGAIPTHYLIPRARRRSAVEENLAAADAAVPVVSLEEVIEWHAQWIPEPARPLWRELHSGDILIRRGAGRNESIVQIQLNNEQMLSINVSPCGAGDNNRRVNVIWTQGSLVKSPSMSIGYAELDLLNKTMTGANGEDLTRR
jgi:hypothetical protein